MSAIPKIDQEADGKLRNELAIAHYTKAGHPPKWNRETLQLLHSFSMSDGEISELWKGQQPPLVGVARKRNSFWEVNYPKECPPSAEPEAVVEVPAAEAKPAPTEEPEKVEVKVEENAVETAHKGKKDKSK